VQSYTVWYAWVTCQVDEWVVSVLWQKSSVWGAYATKSVSHVTECCYLSSIVLAYKSTTVSSLTE